MQQTDQTPAAADTKPRVQKRRSLIRRFVAVYYILLAIILLALIPPYISVNRYQRRIAASISQSLGRPVHLDDVTLTLLPFPGFTITNLVVSEDPAFGNEPIIRAMSVRANLRVSSLWRHQVEFSSISFTEPSVNLVHLANGKWNLESILIQAARIQAAPTAQKTAGPAPRFPYIEATGARLNLKLGPEKMPISLTDAEFALWLPDPQQWRLRIEARPARTDTIVSDAGIFRLEGTLSRAATLTEVPINLNAEWRAVPLGEASRLILGHDTGLRGDLNLTVHAQGTVGASTLTSHLSLSALRRSEFVPERRLSVDLRCQATATNTFHTFNDLQCTWPPSGSTQPIVLLATIPDIRDLNSATAKIGTPALPIKAPPSTGSAPAATASPPTSPPPESSPAPPSSPPASPASHPTGTPTPAPPSRSPPLPSRAHAPASPPPLSPTSPSTPPSRPQPQLAAATAATHPPHNPPPASFSTPPSSPWEAKIQPPSKAVSTPPATPFTSPVWQPSLNSSPSATPFPSSETASSPSSPPTVPPAPTRIDLTATRPWGAPQTWQDNTTHPTPPRPHPHHPTNN